MDMCSPLVGLPGGGRSGELELRTARHLAVASRLPDDYKTSCCGGNTYICLCTHSWENKRYLRVTSQIKTGNSFQFKMVVSLANVLTRRWMAMGNLRHLRQKKTGNSFQSVTILKIRNHRNRCKIRNKRKLQETTIFTMLWGTK